MAKTYKPRNDFVLMEKQYVEKVRGLVMPQQSLEGRKLVVIAKGPKVEGLEVGDAVLLIGVMGATASEVPGNSDLILAKQEYVALVVEDN